MSPLITYPSPAYESLLASLRAQLMALPRQGALPDNRTRTAYWRLKRGDQVAGVKVACLVAEALGYEVQVRLVPKGGGR